MRPATEEAMPGAATPTRPEAAAILQEDRPQVKSEALRRSPHPFLASRETKVGVDEVVDAVATKGPTDSPLNSLSLRPLAGLFFSGSVSIHL